MRTFEEFIKECIDAGFEKTDGDPVHPVVYYLTDFDESADRNEMPRLLLHHASDRTGFIFTSGLGNESIYLTVLDPKKVIEWSHLISDIDSHY